MFLLYMISESNASSLKRLKVLVKKKKGGIQREISKVRLEIEENNKFQSPYHYFLNTKVDSFFKFILYISKDLRRLQKTLPFLRNFLSLFVCLLELKYVLYLYPQFYVRSFFSSRIPSRMLS